MQITIISGDLNTVGSVLEIPWAEGNLGVGPIYRVDPKTRKAQKDLQRFEITAIHEEGKLDLKPIHGQYS